MTRIDPRISIVGVFLLLVACGDQVFKDSLSLATKPPDTSDTHRTTLKVRTPDRKYDLYSESSFSIEILSRKQQRALCEYRLNQKLNIFTINNDHSIGIRTKSFILRNDLNLVSNVTHGIGLICSDDTGSNKLYIIPLTLSEVKCSTEQTINLKPVSVMSEETLMKFLDPDVFVLFGNERSIIQAEIATRNSPECTPVKGHDQYLNTITYTRFVAGLKGDKIYEYRDGKAELFSYGKAVIQGAPVITFMPTVYADRYVKAIESAVLNAEQNALKAEMRRKRKAQEAREKKKKRIERIAAENRRKAKIIQRNINYRSSFARKDYVEWKDSGLCKNIIASGSFNAARSDFETKSEYKARISQELKKKYGDILENEYAVTVKYPKIKYQLENSRWMVEPYKYKANDIVWGNLSIKIQTTSYIGQNAFGVTLSVNKTESTDCVLVTSRNKEYFSLPLYFPMQKEKAKTYENRLKVTIFYKFDPLNYQLYSLDLDWVEPTISSPFESRSESYRLHIKPHAVVLHAKDEVLAVELY